MATISANIPTDCHKNLGISQKENCFAELVKCGTCLDGIPNTTNNVEWPTKRQATDQPNGARKSLSLSLIFRAKEMDIERVNLRGFSPLQLVTTARHSKAGQRQTELSSKWIFEKRRQREN